MSILEYYLGTQMKVAISAFMREVVIRILTIILIVLFAANYISFPDFVIGSIVIYAVPIVIFLLIARKTKGFGFSFRVRDFSKKEYKEMAHFSWYHLLLVVTIMFMGTMDVLMLPFYDKAGLSSVAIYSVAVFIIAFLQIPYKAMYTATFAVLAQAFTNNDIAKAKDIFKRSSINILIATTGVSLLIFCNMENAVAVIKNGYGEIAPVFGILLIGRLADLSTGMNDSVLTITNYYKFNVYISSVLLVLLFLSLRFFIPIYGVYGAAWSTTITLVVFNIAKYIFVWKKLDMQPYTPKTLLVILAGLPALAAGYFMPHFFNQVRHIYIHAFLDTAVRTIVIIIVYFGMLLWLKPSVDLEEYIALIKKEKRLF